MSVYTALTFAPVQGFIEKSRKLRDLFGASLILSYLSYVVVEKALETDGVLDIISPGCVHLQKGMPNRILLKGNFSPEDYQETLLSTWKAVLTECRKLVEEKLPEFGPYNWEEDWKNWGNHTWELFWGQGNSISEAMEDLETNKLARDWIGINWMGESSSLTGTDAIAWPGLGSFNINPKCINYKADQDKIEKFYKQLAWVLDGKKPEEKEQPEGKYIAPNEKLSIPELVKRLVTWSEISEKLRMEGLEKGFKDIVRKTKDGKEGQWTGWFMGDGDKVGDHLKNLAQEEHGEEEIKQFSDAMRTWGENFYQQFPRQLGRVIYSGGDDFLGVIYNKDFPEKSQTGIKPIAALKWLMGLPEEWKKHDHPLTLSVGFIWAAPGVPQRDVLQHCREAEKCSKQLGRNRVTIRIVFRTGQFVQWTCPWQDLDILKHYQDRNGNQDQSLEEQEANKKPNWSHIYKDLAQLESRHAFGLNLNDKDITIDSNDLMDNRHATLEFFDIYFPSYREYLKQTENEKRIVGYADNAPERAKAMTNWIHDLIVVGWYLCSDT